MMANLVHAIRFCVVVIITPTLLYAITAHQLPVHQLPFREDEYPYSVIININNTTNEPVFVLTRGASNDTTEIMMVDPFSTESYTITIPERREISKTWVLFAFNEESLQQLAKNLNTSRSTKYIVRAQSGLVGIVSIVRQKKWQPTLRTISIYNINLDEDSAWKIE
jgi:hypothetical protein